MTTPRLPRDRGPAVRFPPPLLFVIGFTLGASLERWIPLPVRIPDHPWVAAMGLCMIGVGLGLMFTGIITFRRAHTAIIPNQAARALVTHGVYALTRNPMYVGFSMLYLGGVLAAAMLWPLLLFPLVIVALVHTAIHPEERHLRERFPAEYAQYTSRVRRWI